MRSIATALSLMSLALLAAGAASACSGKQTAKPQLKLVRTTPLVVRGEGFRPRVRVTVTALTGLGPRFTRTRTSARGTFKVAIRTASQPCGKAFAVRARGATGQVAIVSVPAAPCVPPPID